jgi:hypothetical protein
VTDSSPAENERDPHGYTDEPPPRLPDPVQPHIHSAWYDGAGKLTRLCAVCGRDLMHEAHLS